MSRKKVKLDFAIDDRASALRAMIERLAPIALDRSTQEWRVDLSRCQYLGPDAVAILAGMVLESRVRGQTIVVNLPQGPSALRAFCHFSGLRHLLDPLEPEPDTRRPDNETVPICVFQTATVTAHEPVVQLIERHVEASIEFKMVLGFCISEIMQNVQDHSQSPFGGVTIAKYFANRNEVRVAIVDRGKGIFSTLQPRYPQITTPLQALVSVVRGNFSARSRENNLGLGISNLCDMVRNYGGHVFIITDGILGEMRMNGRWNYEDIAATFTGTGVFFTLPVT